MIVYRVGKAEYSKDLSGNGARLYGGRWNSVGTACLYSSASRALAVLEYSVNLNILELSKSLVFILIEIPDEEIFEVNIDEIPENWNSYPVNSVTRLFGDNLLKSCKKSIVKIPSVIIPSEFNYLLNPNHINKSEFKIIESESFIFDNRIKSL